jgi:hypothetical protein
VKVWFKGLQINSLCVVVTFVRSSNAWGSETDRARPQSERCCARESFKLDFLPRKCKIGDEEAGVFSMADFASALGASKAASCLLVLFIPSKDRNDSAMDQSFWVAETLTALGKLFGGATAFPQGTGVWRDDGQGGKLLFDEPVIIQCYTSESLIEERISELRAFLHRMGREARQGAIGLVIDGDYLEIGFPLDESSKPKRARSHKRGKD